MAILSKEYGVNLISLNLSFLKQIRQPSSLVGL